MAATDEFRTPDAEERMGRSAFHGSDFFWLVGLSLCKPPAAAPALAAGEPNHIASRAQTSRLPFLA